ncbi:MAG: CHAT domain-containing protein [Pseudomonadota bacterium]
MLFGASLVVLEFARRPSTATEFQASAAGVRWLDARLSADGSGRVCAAGASALPSLPCKRRLSEQKAALRQRTLLSVLPTLSNQEKALAWLISGRSSAGAAQLLEQALQQRPRDSSLWSDLAAAEYLARDDDDDWRSLERALAATWKALEYAKNRRASDNRSLILHTLGLTGQAGRLRAGTPQLTEGPPTMAERTRGGADRETELTPGHSAASPMSASALPAWLGAPGRSELVSAMLDDGRLLSRLAADAGTVCVEEAAAWQTLSASLNTQHKSSLLTDTIDWVCGAQAVQLEALGTLAKAVRLYGENDTAQAEAHAKAALLVLAATPLEVIAKLTIGSSYFAAGMSSEAEPGLSVAAASVYPEVAARAHERLGTLRSRQSNVEQALGHYDRARELLAGGSDPARWVRIGIVSADAYSLYGQPDAAWRSGLSALREARRQRLSPELLAFACEVLSIVATDVDAKQLNYVFSQCAVDVLEGGGDANQAASVHRARAAARFAAGDRGGAIADLETARAHARTLPAQDRRTVEGYLDLTAGQVHLEASPQRAQTLFARGKAHFLAQDSPENAIIASQGLVDALYQQRLYEESEEELKELTKLIGQSQALAESTAVTQTIHQHRRGEFERLIRAQLRRGDQLAALTTLVAARRPKEMATLNSGVLLERLAPAAGSVRLVYAWVLGEVSCWVISSTGQVRWFESPRPPAADQPWELLVDRALGRHQETAIGGRRAALSALYDGLIRPALAYADSSDTLIVAPDGALFGVPFAALWDSQTGEFLIQQRRVAVVPELLAGAAPGEATSAAQSGRGHATRVVIYANPAADPSRPLASLRSERRAVADAFVDTHATVHAVTAANANSRTFLQALQDYEVVHFGGHGEVDPRSPGQSRLIFSSGADGRTADSLSVADIDDAIASASAESVGNRHARLVVLAGCSTAGYARRLPHALSLTRPLLALGVEQVLGSLREIEDAAYLDLMRGFYLRYAETGDARQALHDTQVGFAQATSVDAPAGWQYLQLFSYL